MVRRAPRLQVSKTEIRKNLYGNNRSWLIMTRKPRKQKAKNKLFNRPGQKKRSKVAVALDSIRITRKK